MFEENIRHWSSHRAVCKLLSIFTAIGLLLGGALGRLGTETLLCSAAPLLMFALMEVGYTAREAFFAEQTRASKEDELPSVLPRESALESLGGFVVSLCALSIWPFYLALWAIFVAGAVNIPRHLVAPVAAVADVAVTGRAATPLVFPGVRNNGQPSYPMGTVQRLPNGIPTGGPYPGFPRPATPVNFGPHPMVRPAITPPTPSVVPPTTPTAGSSPPK